MIFYFRLARELGMTVGRLLHEASSSEVSGWLAFLEIENEISKKKIESEKKNSVAASESTLRARIDLAGKIAASKKKKK